MTEHRRDALGAPGTVFVASGHGGRDPGTTVGSLVERDLNAAVAAVVVRRLRDHGIEVWTDLEHGNPAFPAEAELARRLGDPTYYLAIHHNHHHGDARGAEAFGRRGVGAELARSLLDELVAAFRILDPAMADRGVRDDGGTGAEKHLDVAPGRAALVELCFLSSAADRKLVEHPDYAALAGEALCRAIVDHGRVDGAWESRHDRGGHPLPPVVSVVVPTVDRPEMLAEAVASVCGQSVTGVEVLVVDDGVGQGVTAFDDDRVHVLTTGGGAGPSVARNVAIAAARGRILAFLDDDDRWTPTRLDLALQGLRRAPVAVCGTQHIGRPAVAPRRLDGRVGDAILHGTTPCLGATAVQREVAPRFDERWHGVEDVVWWWELAGVADVATEEGVGYLVRLHDGPRGTNTLDQRVEENLTLLRQHPLFRTDREAAAHRWLRVGVLATQAGDHRTAVRAFGEHLRRRPRVGAVAHLVLALGRWGKAAAGRVRTGARGARLREGDLAATSGLRTTHLIMSDRARGAEQAARFVADALDADGSVNRVVALRHSDGSGGRVAVDDALLGQRGRLFRMRLIPVVLRLRRDVRRHRPEVVLAHGSAPAVVAALASLLGGFPPLVWHRILVFPVRSRWHPTELAWRLVAVRAAGVVAITEATVQEVRALGFVGPVWLVPNHRPAEQFEDLDRVAAGARLRQELGVPADAPLLGFVGHLVAQKAPGLALDAFEILRETVPDAHLVVVGDGVLRAALEERAQSFGGSLHLLGHRDDVPRILAGLDVMVGSSQSDSMPGIVVEAQLAGCPVVSLETDGIADALDPGNSGLVVSDRSADALASSVASVLGAPDRLRAMSAAALAHGGGMTTAAMAPRYAALLRSVAGRGELRVLHVLPDLGSGGAERSLAVLGRHLDPGHAVQLVVTLRGDRRPRAETVAPELDDLGIGRADLGLHRAPTRSVLAAALGAHRLGRLARRWHADVVDAALLDASLVSRLARSRAVRVSHLVNTPWDPVVAEASGGARWRRRVLRRVDRWSSRRDDALVAITEAVAAAARRDLGATIDRRLRVIGRGVDLERYPVLPGAPAGTPGELRLVAVGRLVPQKGHDVLVRAVAKLIDRGVAASLTVVGEGPGRPALEKLAFDLGIFDAIQLVGAHADVRSFLREAHLFVLASRWEGQSNAVLEAMASGRAVVVGDVPALREVVADAGVLVVPDDVEAWADALEGLTADASRRAALAAAGRTRVEEHFGAPARSAELGALYQDLIARTRPQVR